MADIRPDASTGMPPHMHLQQMQAVTAMTEMPVQTQTQAQEEVPTPAFPMQPAPEPLEPLTPSSSLAAPVPPAASGAMAAASTQEEPRVTTLVAVGAELQPQPQPQPQAQLQPQVSPPAPATSAPSQPKRKNLSDQQRMAIVQFLLANSVGGKLKHGDMKSAATHFQVHRATVQRLWKLHLATSNAEGLAGNVASRIKGRSGRKPKFRDEELKARIAAVPAERRMTGRALSAALGINNGVVVRLIRDGKLKRHPKKLHYVM